MKYEKINRVSAQSVKKHTGKDWDQWIQILSKAGAKNWAHSEIAKYLAQKHKLSLWWRQGVAIGFEIAMGMRQEGQNLKGEYGLAFSRTVPASASATWRFLSSAEGIRLWLQPMGDFELQPKQAFEVEGGVFGEVRTLKAGSRVRFTWAETEWPKATTVQLMVHARSSSKCLIGVQHEGLRNPRQREQMRVFWKTRVKAVIAALQNLSPKPVTAHVSRKSKRAANLSQK